MDRRTRILSEGQQETLSEEKIDHRLDNEKYLRSHPELSDLIRCLFDSLVASKPDSKELILKFICEYFQKPDLPYQVTLYAQQRESDLLDYDNMMDEQ
ncbi:hypothetical protein BLNAU_9000 [Blattamonas nauphoetae]|uniref:RIIa domain-containing protein n=1 Tax=Blattamonas nauphoetae TaxID=2049346 RepID=A0ABQ9XX14_9EUKA|nr:hypothetical protein BLNAU_9000 [Blattamonas nauphoetae]